LLILSRFIAPSRPLLLLHNSRMSTRRATKKTVVKVKTEDEEVEETKTKVSTEKLRSRLRGYAFAEDGEKEENPTTGTC
jgi:hypothetical protein